MTCTIPFALAGLGVGPAGNHVATAVCILAAAQWEESSPVVAVGLGNIWAGFVLLEKKIAKKKLN